MSTPIRRIISKSQRSTGNAAVEMAFVIVFLLLIVAGIVEFGRTFWYYNALSKATRDGARLMSMTANTELGDRVSGANDTSCVPGGAATATRLVYCGAVFSRVPGFGTANVQVRCDYGTGAWVACRNGPAQSGYPTDVRVAIVGYTLTVGEWIPFLAPTGDATSFLPTTYPIPLTSATVMRYMR